MRGPFPSLIINHLTLAHETLALYSKYFSEDCSNHTAYAKMLRDMEDIQGEAEEHR